MFYTFAKRHWLTTQIIRVYARSFTDARLEAKRIAGSGLFLFLVAVEG